MFLGPSTFCDLYFLWPYVTSKLRYSKEYFILICQIILKIVVPPPTPHTQIFIQPFSHQIYFLLKNASLCVNWKLYLKDVEDNWVFFERCDFKIIGHWKLGRKLDDFPITYMLSGSPQDVSRAKAEIDDMITKV